MIPFASQRGGGQDLATHLMNAYDNEIVEIAMVRGAVAKDLHGAFKEWEVQAAALTRCRKYLYSLSVNPDPAQGPLTREQYMDYVGRVEDALGLADQPRAIVFHTKYGREHCHVAWSRIDAEQGKAVHLAFDHDTLMRVTRAFARDHGLRLPPGYEKSRQVGQLSMYELEQYRRTGISKEERMRQVTEAWQQSDGAKAFVQALSERGYLLARGDRRDYVLVDLYGHVGSIPKLIEDKAVRTKQVRAYLEEDFPLEVLPGVEEAQALVERHRTRIETGVSREAHEAGLAALRLQQRERRAGLERAAALGAQQRQQARDTLRDAQAAQRMQMKLRQRREWDAIRAQRQADRPTGLAAFLGRVTGIEAIRAVWHRRQDAQRLEVFRQERRQMRSAHGAEQGSLERRLMLDEKEQARLLAGLRRVERRELAAFLRDQRRDQRERDRGGTQDMPSLAHLAAKPKVNASPERQPHDLLAAFEQAKERRWLAVPEIARDFGRAADEGRSRPTDSGEGREIVRGPSGDRDNSPGRKR